MILRLCNVEREETDEARIKAMKAQGYIVVRDDRYDAYEEPKEAAVDLSVLMKAELVEMAEREGIEKPKRMTKAQLVEVLERR